MNKKECESCGKEYIEDPKFTKNDREKEYKENFPNDPNITWEIVSVCEDCYIKFKIWLDSLTLEEREEIEKEGLLYESKL